MSEIQYKNRSISQLVSELNTLGQDAVLLQPAKLLAIHDQDLPEIKRYKNTNGDQFFTCTQQPDKKYPYNDIASNLTSSQFQSMKQLFERGFNVTVIITSPRQQNKLTQLLSILSKWMEQISMNSKQSKLNNRINCLVNGLQFTQNSIIDMIGGSKITQRDVQNRLKYYKIGQSGVFVSLMNRLVREQAKANSITLYKVKPYFAKQKNPALNVINILVFPEQFHNLSLKQKQHLGTVKSQLTQILNYIKTNPSKKYQHFSKLITKRLPATNIIAQLLLQQSATFILNWISQSNIQQKIEKLNFYQKIRGISVLLKKQEEKQEVMGSLITELPSIFTQNQSVSNKRQRLGKSKQIIKASKTDRTPIAQFSNEEESQLQYCRSLERKTHKYSINQGQLFNDSPVDGSSDFKITYNQNQNIEPFNRPTSKSNKSNIKAFARQSNSNESKGFYQQSNMPSPIVHSQPFTISSPQFENTLPRPKSQNETSQIAILKSAHAIEISQYHQTIQHLNRKIMALTQSNNLEQLYAIHERELMVLELKIKQLREDITILSGSTDQKSLKGIVRKLNEEVKKIEGKYSEQKICKSKLVLVEKQVKEWREKYQQSQNNRKKLVFQLQHLTKRLKICDAQIQNLNKKQMIFIETGSNNCPPSNNNNKVMQFPHTNQNSKLSLTDLDSLDQIKILITSIKQDNGSEQSQNFLIRKITNILEDLSHSRDIILECNDFLVQLEEHLEETLGKKQPQIVLDCNKFIRGFLMQNLNIF